MEPIPSGHTLSWVNLGTVKSQRFTCWYCGNPLASDRGWVAKSTYSGKEAAYVCICHYCQRPTFIDELERQHPGTVYGSPVQDVADKSVEGLYDEARLAIGAGAYTSAVLACRKLLMHIAVAKGAKEGESFLSYVQYLADNHYIPPDARAWVDHIREKGNEANHEIVIMSADDAKELVAFCEMLLKIIYQFPAAVRKRTSSQQVGAS